MNPMFLDVVPSAPLGPVAAFDALVQALARGDDVDAAVCDAVCRAAGKTVTDLANAVRASVFAGGFHLSHTPPEYLR